MGTSLHDSGRDITFTRTYAGDGLNLLLYAAVVLAALEATTPGSMLLGCFGLDNSVLPETLYNFGIFVGMLRGFGLHYVVIGLVVLLALACFSTYRILSYNRETGLLTCVSYTCMMGGSWSYKRKNIIKVVFVRLRKVVQYTAGSHSRYGTVSSKPGHFSEFAGEKGIIRIQLTSGDYREVFDAPEHVDVMNAARAIAAAMEVGFEETTHTANERV